MLDGRRYVPIEDEIFHLYVGAGIVVAEKEDEELLEVDTTPTRQESPVGSPRFFAAKSDFPAI